MKVLLIYPEYPATFWSFKYALPFINKKASLPPLGLLTVSSLLPEDWQKKLVDMNIDHLKDEDIKWADLIFISGMIVQKRSAQSVINRVKAFNKKVIAGGPLFTTGHKDFYNVDSFILNEGEVTIPLFLEDLRSGRLKPVYSSAEKPDISKTPVPDWSLIKTKNYASLSLQVSRGCPFNCDFCDIIIMYGRVPRLKEADQIIQEMEAIHASGWRGNVFVVDDNFIGNKMKIKIVLRRLAEWMKEKKYPFVLNTEGSIDLANDEELMDLMLEANFNSVFIGIETPDEETLKSCGKYQNTKKDLVEKIKIIQRKGIEVQAGFIVGFDNDHHGTFQNIINFIQKSGIVTAMVGLLSAMPETALYKRLHKSNRIVTGASGNNTDFTLNFIPKMNKQKLIEGYKTILNTIFEPHHFYKRIVVFLKEYKSVAKFKRINILVQFKAFFRSLWQFGITGRGKHHFWKMFFWTLFKKPRLLVRAITLSVYGYHFREVLVRIED
ncbi:MAG: DUF4070 domain-containing protein [Spirochaetes bacterium]|nr:DUF4070 domain-containing protein [Spirochaetota bacterium]